MCFLLVLLCYTISGYQSLDWLQLDIMDIASPLLQYNEKLLITRTKNRKKLTQQVPTYCPSGTCMNARRFTLLDAFFFYGTLRFSPASHYFSLKNSQIANILSYLGRITHVVFQYGKDVAVWGLLHPLPPLNTKICLKWGEMQCFIFQVT